ncbi:MAG: hypothetical protein GQ574_29015 [Crocinitomix sp.]|nr:hypothetical protein [Crocinitomix sp.]
MKILQIIALIMLSNACSETSLSDQESETKSIPEDSIMLNDLTEAVGESGERVQFDSLHFSIIRRKHPNGEPYIERVLNKDNKIDSWKEYYENGRIKRFGLMSSVYHYYIGEWEYYSENGELDSLVNYDNEHSISYYNAIEIAKENGYEMPNMELVQTFTNEIMTWQVNRWTTNENGGGRTAETILIDCETGKVTELENQLISVF